MGLGPKRSPSATASGADGESNARRRRYREWLAVSVLLAIAGMVGSVIAANSVAGSNAAASRQALRQSSSQVASGLQLAVEQQQDLELSGAAFLLSDPGASNSEFARWGDSLQAFRRYPELLSWGEAVIVPSSKLAEFETRAMKDPAGRLPRNRVFRVTPSGARPFYCLLRVLKARTPQLVSAAGVDYCAGALGSSILGTRDSGQGFYAALTVAHAQVLVTEVPFYRGSVTPATVAARRRKFVGWIGTVLAPSIVLDAALRDHPHTAVAFRFHNASSGTIFHAGHAPPGARSVTTDLHNGWTVETFAHVASGGVFADRAALALLVGGILVSLLLALLLLVLGTSTGSRKYVRWGLKELS